MPAPVHNDFYGDVIPLAPNSLYICLTQLLQAGRFHWSLYITDANGTATQHQWAEICPRARTEPAEAYVHGVVERVTEFTPGNTINLAFVRLEAFAPPELEFDYSKAFAGIFEGYTTVKENRAHDVTCRTWLMAALQILGGHGLVRLSSAQIAALEKEVIAIGVEAEELLAVQGSAFKTPMKTL